MKKSKKLSKEKSFENLYEEKQIRHLKYEKSTRRIVYWTVILVLTISNFIVAIVLIPFLLVISTVKFFILVAALGLIFGFLFDLLIRDIEHLETRHHVFAVIFIPLVSIVNLFLMVGAANRLVDILKIGHYEDPILTSLIYIVAFMLPYIVNILRKEL